MRSSWRLAALAALVLVGSCDEKDSDFFTTVVGEGDGTLGLSVVGPPAGATLTVSRGGSVVFSGIVGSTPHILEGLHFGTYEVAITPPGDYDCGTETVTVNINAITPDPDVTFTCVAPVGSFALSLSGLGSGLALDATLSGPVNRTGQLGGTGLSFTGLPLGNYTWGYNQIGGYGCLPVGGTFALTTVGQQATAQVTCNATEGALQATVAGATADVSYSGPESGGSAVGATPVVFPGLTPGNYTVSISNPSGFNCLPASQQATVTAGATASVQFNCTPLPGTVTATVTGATAQVNYTGAASGGAPVGATPVPFTGLPAGNYTFAIVAPGGFTCTPATIPVVLAAGGAESVQFACTPVGMQPTTVSAGLSGFQGSAGAVPAGTYPRPALDEFSVQRGTVNVSTIGTSTFYGTGPFRLGSGPFSGWRFDLDFDIDAQPYNITGYAVCVLNTTLDGTHPMRVSYKNAALAELDFDLVTSAPFCFWGTVPANTRYVDVTGPDDRFIDINNIQFWRAP